jgi:CheY-like chemotaxis protein
VTELVTRSIKHAGAGGRESIEVVLAEAEPGSCCWRSPTTAVATRRQRGAELGPTIVADLVQQLKGVLSASAERRLARGGAYACAGADMSERMGLEDCVAVVDDEFLIATGLSLQLEGLGLSVCGTAATAEEALALAIARRPAIVLMDVRLGGEKDGVDAARAIHAAVGSKVIFVTGVARAGHDGAHPPGSPGGGALQAGLGLAVAPGDRRGPGR